MITASSLGEQREAIDALLPFQREDFVGLFRAMDGLPVIIRLLDPPLHEFLPSWDDAASHGCRPADPVGAARPIWPTVEATRRGAVRDPEMLERVEDLREANPMLGLRGVRLGLKMPDADPHAGPGGLRRSARGSRRRWWIRDPRSWCRS